MIWGDFWRRFKIAAAYLPMRRKALVCPAFLYRDIGQGDIEQGLRLVNHHFLLDWQLYYFSQHEMWSMAWPPEVRRWFYSFVWLRDLRELGTNEARLAARAFIITWIEQAPSDPIAQEGPVMGQRLASWLGHYEFCLKTAKSNTQKRVMDVLRREGRILAALLPLSPQGWRGLLALRGLLAAFMAVPDQEGFFLRFQRYFPQEIERLMLPGGSVVDRSPEAQFQCVQELASLMVMFNAMHVPIPSILASTLVRACPVLRAFCHGDGRLAVFNGSVERTEEELQTLLEHAERYHVIASSLSGGGFERLTLGRSMLFVDAAAPPNKGNDYEAHAGTLSFEFSHHKHRFFVNCGACVSGSWKQAMRESAAHNVLIADGLSSSDFTKDGHISRYPSCVEKVHHSTGEAHWLDMSHNGYYPSLGAIWSRQLYLGGNGEDLRGCDVLEGERDVRFMLRFHIHPDVRVVPEDNDIILRVGDEIWRFCQAGGILTIDQDLYLGRQKPEKTSQIIVYSRSGRYVESDDSGRRKRQQRISWMLERVPA